LCALSPIIVHSCTRVLGKRNCLRELWIFTGKESKTLIMMVMFNVLCIH
jgi:hypothetical protein